LIPPGLAARSLRRAPALFATGAIVGTLGDRIHTYFGVVRYPRTLLWGEAWWVPLLMGSAALLFVESHALLGAALGERRPAPDRLRLARAGLAFAAAYLASGVFREHPAALTLAFAGGFVALALAHGARSPALWAHGIATGLFGIVFETGLSATGAFQHTSVDVLLVPMWLGALYLHAALFAREIDLALP
jgi:hypothetical protein